MTTRRDTFRMTAGAALATLGLKPLTTAASTPPEPFDCDKYSMAWTLMTVAGGVHAATVISVRGDVRSLLRREALASGARMGAGPVP